MKDAKILDFAAELTLIGDVLGAKGRSMPELEAALRIRRLADWMRAQGGTRKVWSLRASEFFARCPAAVRDAARAVIRRALDLRLEQDAAAKPATPAKKAVRKRKAAPKKERTDLMSDEDYAEMLQRMDPFEAARIQREE